MEAALDTINKVLPGLQSKKNDDVVDRLSNQYTVVLLLVFASLVGFYQLTGRPIVCWAPVHFTGSHTSYANSYCWVRNTYYLPFEEDVPRVGEERQMVVYYQWIPIILLAQALLFYMPSVVWHGLNSKAGVDSDNILAAAHLLTKANTEEKREKVLLLTVKQIDRFLGTRLEHGRGWRANFKKAVTVLCRLCGRRFGNYLVSVWILSKLFYMGNLLFQLFILNHVLGTNYNQFGVEMLKGTTSDHDWHLAPYTAFPRVTMCDFKVRRLGNVHRYTVQCTLPLNLWTEKIYTFLWFWMVLLITFNIVALLQWLIRFLIRSDRLRFVQKHLHTFDKIPDERDVELSKDFVYNYLRQDGGFVLRLISHNTNSLATSAIICGLWDLWRAKPKKRSKDAMDAYHHDDDEEEEEDTQENAEKVKLRP